MPPIPITANHTNSGIVVTYDDFTTQNISFANKTLSINRGLKVSAGDSDLQGKLDVSKAANLKSTLHVAGASVLDSSLAVAGNATPGYNLTVTGASKLKGAIVTDSSLAVAGAATSGYNLTVTGKSKLKGDVALDSALVVANNSDLRGALNVVGPATMNTLLTVGGPAAPDSKFTVTGKSKLKGDVDVSGSLAIGGSFTVDSDLTVNGNLNVIGRQTVIDTVNLSVKDNAIMLASGNTNDSIQSGVSVQYKPSGSTASKYAGVKRLPGTGEFIFYKDADKPIEPNAGSGMIGEADTAGEVARTLNLKNEAIEDVTKLEAVEADALADKTWAQQKKTEAFNAIPVEPTLVTTSPAVTGEWMTIDFGAVTSVPRLILGELSNPANPTSMVWNQSYQIGTGFKSFDLYQSNDNVNWTFVRNVTHDDSSTDGNIAFASPLSLRYLRFVIVSLRHYNRDPDFISLANQEKLTFFNSQLLTFYNLNLSAVSVSSGLGAPTVINSNTSDFPYWILNGIPNSSFHMTLLNSGDWNQTGSTNQNEVYLKTYTGDTVAIPGVSSPEDIEAYNLAYAAWLQAKIPFIATYDASVVAYNTATTTYNTAVAATNAARQIVTNREAPYQAALAANTAYNTVRSEAAAAAAQVGNLTNIKEAAAEAAVPFQEAATQAATNLVAATSAKATAFNAIPVEPTPVTTIPAAIGEWMTIDFGAVTSVPRLILGELSNSADPTSMVWNQSYQIGTGFKSFDLYQSNDNVNWTFVRNVTHDDSSTDGNIAFASPLSLRYLRFVIVSLRHFNRDPDFISLANQEKLTFFNSQLLRFYNLSLSAVSVSSGLGTPTVINSNTSGFPYWILNNASGDSFHMTLLNSGDWNQTGSTNQNEVYLKTYTGDTVAIPGVSSPDAEAEYQAAYSNWLIVKAPLIAAYNATVAAYDAAVIANNTAASELNTKLALLSAAEANLAAAVTTYNTKKAAKDAFISTYPSNGIYAVVMASAFNSASDARLKKNIVNLDGALDRLDHIRGVYHEWTNEHESKERQIGVIAQEIQEVYPELVQLGGNGYLSVNYPKLTAVLLQSIKELKQRHNESINELKEMIQSVVAQK